MSILVGRYLPEIAARIGQQVTETQISALVITEAMNIFQANAGMLSLLTEDGSLFKNIEIIGYPQEVVADWPFCDADVSFPISDAVRARTPISVETWEDRRARYPHLAEVHAIGGDGGFVAVPLLHPTRRTALGGIGLSFPHSRSVSEEEWILLLTLSDLCAQALERVSLTKDIRRQHYRLEAAEEALEYTRQQYRILQNNFELTVRQHQGLIDYTQQLHKTVRTHREQRERDAKVRAMQQENLKYEMQEQKYIFMRDMLSSVTEGKLRLCAEPRDLPTPRKAYQDDIRLSAEGGIRELRHVTRQAASEAGLTVERAYDMEMAVGEAALNAVAHGHTGTGHVSIESGNVQVRVTDKGAGIADEHLPLAALARGWSTKESFGHGLPMMIQAASRVFLLTGTHGTTVVLEQDNASLAW